MLSTSESLLVSIQEKIKWADSMSEIDKKHRKDVEEKVEEVKKSIFKVGWIYFDEKISDRKLFTYNFILVLNVLKISFILLFLLTSRKDRNI